MPLSEGFAPLFIIFCTSFIAWRRGPAYMALHGIDWIEWELLMEIKAKLERSWKLEAEVNRKGL